MNCLRVVGWKGKPDRLPRDTVFGRMKGLRQADGGGASPEVGPVGSEECVQDWWSVRFWRGWALGAGGIQSPRLLSHPPALPLPGKRRGWESCLGWEAQGHTPSSDVLGSVSVPCLFILPPRVPSVPHPLSFKQ